MKYHGIEVMPSFFIQDDTSFASGSVGASSSVKVSNGAIKPNLFVTYDLPLSEE